MEFWINSFYVIVETKKQNRVKRVVSKYEIGAISTIWGMGAWAYKKATHTHKHIHKKSKSSQKLISSTMKV